MTSPSEKLPPELLSLVHHIELHRSGWWDKALQQLVLYGLGSEKGFMTADHVCAAISESYTVNVDPPLLDDQLKVLRDDGKVIESASGSYKITEEEVDRLGRDTAVARDIEERARLQFVERLSTACPEIDGDQCWKDFNQQCLVPLVLEMGARTYAFFSTSKEPPELSFEYSEFFAQYGATEGECLREVVLDFISPNDPLIRDYMLRTLDAAFFLEASGLRRDALDRLSTLSVQFRSLTLFLDTNLLFSALNLHDNPSNQSVATLLNLISDITSTVNCKMYVLPITVDEFTRTLSANCADLKNVSPSPNVALAVVASGRLSGVKMRYVQACQEAGMPISAEDYFAPYLRNPVVVMRERGIELYNAKLDDYEDRQEVLDDIAELWDISDQRVKNDSLYRALKHDMTMLHFAADLRPSAVKSAADAQSWIVTIDNRLIRFNRKKGNAVPVCIHPSMLIQMLRFWVPRTEAFEAAVIESIRIPFAFRRFDASSERVAVRILEVLSRYEIGDLPTEVITQVLVSDAIQGLLLQTDDDEETVAIIREGFLSAHAELQAKLDSAKEEGKTLRSVAEEQSGEIDLYKSIAEDQSGRIGILEDDVKRSSAALHKLERALGDAKQSLSHQAEQMEDLKGNLVKSEVQATTAQVGKEYYTKWIVIPVVIGSLMIAGTASLAHMQEWVSPVLVTIVMAGLSIIAILGLADWRGSRYEELRAVDWYLSLRKWRSWIYGLLTTLVVGVVAGIVAQFFEVVR